VRAWRDSAESLHKNGAAENRRLITWNGGLRRVSAVLGLLLACLVPCSEEYVKGDQFLVDMAQTKSAFPLLASAFAHGRKR